MAIGAPINRSNATTYTSLGTYNLSDPNNTGSPLFVGGVECVGVSGTGTFNQSGGTNAIVGGGDYNKAGAGAALPGYFDVPYGSYTGALMLGWYSGDQTFGVPATGYFGNGVGNYNLSGGLLTGGNPNNTMGGIEVVGVAGTGIFTQTGGTNIASRELDVGGPQSNWSSIMALPNNLGYGTYSLSNGLLTTAFHGEYRREGRHGDLHADGRDQLNPQLDLVHQGQAP